MSNEPNSQTISLKKINPFVRFLNFIKEIHFLIYLMLKSSVSEMNIIKSISKLATFYEPGKPYTLFDIETGYYCSKETSNRKIKEENVAKGLMEEYETINTNFELPLGEDIFEEMVKLYQNLELPPIFTDPEPGIVLVNAIDFCDCQLLEMWLRHGGSFEKLFKDPESDLSVSVLLYLLFYHHSEPQMMLEKMIEMGAHFKMSGLKLLSAGEIVNRLKDFLYNYKMEQQNGIKLYKRLRSFLIEYVSEYHLPIVHLDNYFFATYGIDTELKKIKLELSGK
jgi:hypothetical protein